MFHSSRSGVVSRRGVQPVHSSEDFSPDDAEAPKRREWTVNAVAVIVAVLAIQLVIIAVMEYRKSSAAHAEALSNSANGNRPVSYEERVVQQHEHQTDTVWFHAPRYGDNDEDARIYDPEARFARPPNLSSLYKPKVLFVVDQPGWAQDHKTENLIRVLSTQGKYDFKKKYHSNITVDDVVEADLVLLYYWKQLLELSHLSSALAVAKDKVAIGICSHPELSGSLYKRGRKHIFVYSFALFGNNHLFYDQFADEFGIPFFYTPNGVDTSMFRPYDPSDPSKLAPPDPSSDLSFLNYNSHSSNVRVGWTGTLNTKWKTELKGVRYIQEAVNMTHGTDLVFSSREQRLLTPADMVRFYQVTHSYICASSAEGTPNPGLESAACGDAQITTKVGNMIFLVRPGLNGYFVNRDGEDIAEKIAIFRDNPSLLRFMRNRGREFISSWDWKDKGKNFEFMIDSVLRYPGLMGLPGLIANGELEDNASDLLHVAPQWSFHSVSEVTERVSAYLTEMHINTTGIRARHPSVSVFILPAGEFHRLLPLLKMTVTKHIIFYHTEIAALEYSKLMYELLLNADSVDDLVQSIFCRSLSKASLTAADLNVYNQFDYLSLPVEPALVKRVKDRLSKRNQHRYESFIEPFITGPYTLSQVNGTKGQKRMIIDPHRLQILPCWPLAAPVPLKPIREPLYIPQYDAKVSETTRRQRPVLRSREFLPNLISLFVGSGFLRDDVALLHIQKKLEDARRLSFSLFEILEEDIRVLTNMSESIVMDVPAEARHDPRWHHKLETWRTLLSYEDGYMVISSGDGSMEVLRSEPARILTEKYIVGDNVLDIVGPGMEHDALRPKFELKMRWVQIPFDRYDSIKDGRWNTILIRNAGRLLSTRGADGIPSVNTAFLEYVFRFNGRIIFAQDNLPVSLSPGEPKKVQFTEVAVLQQVYWDLRSAIFAMEDSFPFHMPVDVIHHERNNCMNSSFFMVVDRYSGL